ncbi:carbohydrate kinase [Pedobacter yulinensis]|uniref:Carbohydrate kinase n=1 Tax=Pedobacter yulinensis TaxID=2126353 RepID=A0A2T3HKD2_9SPHI|nr:FGGY family carbohydrate kinase [Pedobacter yulinensis]PST82879.1 carbohydrate kinase [Pedobacter yulinensis]
MQKPVVAIFDVGKTNKKLLLFDEDYQLVYERAARFLEVTDEDGDACENLDGLRLSVFDSLREIGKLNEFTVKAVNFSTYGASFVYTDNEGRPLTPLYNYLKPYPEKLKERFYEQYGGQAAFATATASPVLGSLNSGMQLYRLKHERPEVFEKVAYALHLPQYMSFLLTGIPCSDLTSIGCHTNLWDFAAASYHPWVAKEGIREKLAPIVPADEVYPAVFPGSGLKVGTGLHDSSSALIPYLINFQEPFVLISTGTWCITLNPFDHSPLSAGDLEQDCLCYLQYKGKPVKAARLFAGYQHEQELKRLAGFFAQPAAKYRHLRFDPQVLGRLEERFRFRLAGRQPVEPLFTGQEPGRFSDDAEAYHALMIDIALQQEQSTRLVLKTPVRRIFVDGGFGKNDVYMNLISLLFPGQEVYAASMAQATAMGAAVCIHPHWNSKSLPSNMIDLKYYARAADR